MEKWYVDARYARKLQGKWFLGGLILGFTAAAISPAIKFVRHVTEKAIRNDIRKELQEEAL